MRLLLLSNSTNAGQGWLDHAEAPIRDFLAGARRVAFVPFAAVRLSWDDFTARLATRLAAMGLPAAVEGLHATADPVAAVRAADAVAVGGGNTFHLLKAMKERGLVEAIGERVRAGLPYVGWSAGANVACPTIRTTNDMPIVEPPGFGAIGLVPFQINPHYLDAHPAGHAGETREERILEFIEANPGVHVVGLREGSWLAVGAAIAAGEDESAGAWPAAGRRTSTSIALLGPHPARIFLRGEAPREVEPGDDLHFLLARAS